MTPKMKNIIKIILAVIAIAGQAKGAVLQCQLYTHSPYSGSYTQDTYSWTLTVHFDAAASAGLYYYADGTGNYASVTKTTSVGTPEDVGITGLGPGATAPYTAITGPQLLVAWLPSEAIIRVGSTDTPVSISVSGHTHIERVDNAAGAFPATLPTGVAVVGALVYTIGAPPPVTGTIHVPYDLRNADTVSHDFKIFADGTEVGMVSVAPGARMTGVLDIDGISPGATLTMTTDGGTAHPFANPLGHVGIEGQDWTSGPINGSWTHEELPEQDPTPDQEGGGNTTNNPPTGPGNVGDPGTTVTQNPRTNVNNGNTTIGGGSSGATNLDIYNDVLAALKDAGNSGTFSGVPAQDITDNTDNDAGEWEDVMSTLQEASDGIDDAKTNAQAGTNALKDKMTLPTGIGQVTSINFGTLTFGAESVPIECDLSGPVGSKVAYIRAAILLVLTGLFIRMLMAEVPKFI